MKHLWILPVLLAITQLVSAADSAAPAIPAVFASLPGMVTFTDADGRTICTRDNRITAVILWPDGESRVYFDPQDRRDFWQLAKPRQTVPPCNPSRF